MPSINDIILESTNPFDNYRSINFWQPQNDVEPVVKSIHQDVITTIEAALNQVIQDHRPRTLRLEGDPGSGKTYLLGRLKKSFNDKACFAYIKPFPQSDRIWRHILRYTVDGMIKVPEGQQDSQLMLWLRSLSAFTERTLKQRVFADNLLEVFTNNRQNFIKKLKDIYKQSSIYNADNFFGVLYNLTKPELYSLACQWLQGDDLSEESLKELGVPSSIDSEEAACENLANFGRISDETQPIVLCFDQLESIARLPDGTLDLQTLFSVTTRIHDENNNFLVIISITTDTWKQNEGRIDQSHKVRIDQEIRLKPINLKEAQLILATRLAPLHNQANPRPNSDIYPITEEFLQVGFKRNRTNPREVLIFGRDIFQEYKKWLFGGSIGSFSPFETATATIEPKKDTHAELLANFELKWLDEFTQMQQTLTDVSKESSAELVKMLQEALAALEMEDIKAPFLTGTKFASYSLSYKMPNKPKHIGVVWTEDQNMTSFFYVMEACRKAVQQNLCDMLYLIRESGVGSVSNRGYQVYAEIFNDSPHRRIMPKTLSAQYLATYYELVKDAREGDLVVMGETILLKDLQALIRESKILQDCPVLQELELVSGEINQPPILESVKEFLLNLVVTQQVMGLQALIKDGMNQFPSTNERQINEVIAQLCQEKKIQILDPKAEKIAQLVSLVP